VTGTNAAECATADRITEISQVAHELATTGDDTSRRWSFSRIAVTVVSALFAALLLWRTFAGVDIHAVAALLSRMGPALLLPAGAYLITMSVDSFGWRRLLAQTGWRGPLSRLVALRVSIEAIQLSLPWGSVISESLTPPLLRRRLGVRLPEGVAVSAARKCLFGLTQAVFLVLGAALGSRLIAVVGRSTGVSVSAGLLSVAAVLLAVAVSAAVLLANGNLATAVRRRLRALRIPRLRAFLAPRHAGFGRFDDSTRRLFHLATLARTAPLVLCIWFSEAFETWLSLVLLGVPISFPEAVAVEAGASVLRILGVAVPAGLGVQEVGYVAFIVAIGVADPIAYGAAFSVIKRAKEALWTLVGYGLLLHKAV